MTNKFDMITDVLKFVGDNGSLYYDTDKELFCVIFTMSLNGEVSWESKGETPYLACKDFMIDKMPKIELAIRCNNDKRFYEEFK